jgi:hypothetical protein
MGKEVEDLNPKASIDIQMQAVERHITQYMELYMEGGNPQVIMAHRQAVQRIQEEIREGKNND